MTRPSFRTDFDDVRLFLISVYHVFYPDGQPPSRKRRAGTVRQLLANNSAQPAAALRENGFSPSEVTRGSAWEIVAWDRFAPAAEGCVLDPACHAQPAARFFLVGDWRWGEGGCPQTCLARAAPSAAVDGALMAY